MADVHSEHVAVFWDFENVSPPSGVAGNTLVNKICVIAHHFGTVNTFKAYLDLAQSVPIIRSGMRCELQSSGVSLVDCPHARRKDVADKMIIVDMLAYANDNPAPATLILISGDGDFSYAVSVLRLRTYRVVVMTPKASSASIKYLASLVLDWNRDVLGKSIPASITEGTSQASSVAVDIDGVCDSDHSGPTKAPSRSVIEGESMSRPAETEVPTPCIDLRVGDQSISQGRLLDLASPTQETSVLDRVRYSLWPWVYCARPLQPGSLCLPPSSVTAADMVVGLSPHREDRNMDICLLCADMTTIVPTFVGRSTFSKTNIQRQRVSSSTDGTCLAKQPGAYFAEIGLETPTSIDSPIDEGRLQIDSVTDTVPLPSEGMSPVRKEGDSGKFTMLLPYISSHHIPLPSLNNTSSCAPSVTSRSSPSAAGNASSATSQDTITMAPEFIPLAELLERSRLDGKPRPSRSLIASQLKDPKAIYRKVGTSKFKRYCKLAVEAGIVEVGGGNDPWISLHPLWHGKVRV